MIEAMLTDILGIGVILVLLRMNHTLGGLAKSIKHFAGIIEDHEIRLRSVERSIPVIIEKTETHFHVEHERPGDQSTGRTAS